MKTKHDLEVKKLFRKIHNISVLDIPEKKKSSLEKQFNPIRHNEQNLNTFHVKRFQHCLATDTAADKPGENSTLWCIGRGGKLKLIFVLGVAGLWI